MDASASGIFSQKALHSGSKEDYHFIRNHRNWKERRFQAYPFAITFLGCFKVSNFQPIELAISSD
jgi:hypothetical protein